MTLQQTLAEAATRISRRDAETLLAHVLHQPRAWLLAHPEAEIDVSHATSFSALTARRAAGEPLQYLIGIQEFFGLELHVTPAVLIPRPETEHLVEAVLAWSHLQIKPLRIADIGTGSGAIAVALAAHVPSAEIIATDISADALAIARDNALRLGFSDRIHFVQGHLLADTNSPAAPYDAIVSNPPYIPSGDATTLQREVVEHEPHTALFAGPTGLNIYRDLIPAAHQALRLGGLLAMEIGFGQREALTTLLTSHNRPAWINIKFIDDYADIPRVVLAERA